ncbi:MAG: hypothetical protein GYB67_10080, partial [Chloroflexi bacterium]|nr:hypothetical protein [Chloroflexota bacterium]
MLPDLPLPFAAFVALLFLINAVIQTLRGGRPLGWFGALLAALAIIATTSALILSTLLGNPALMINAVTLANALIVVVISIVIFVIEARRQDRPRQRGHGTLGIGVGALMSVAVFTTPAIIGAFAIPTGALSAASAPASVSMQADSPLIDLLIDETGLDRSTLAAELAAGATIADLINANGGDLERVIAEGTEMALAQL